MINIDFMAFLNGFVIYLAVHPEFPVTVIILLLGIIGVIAALSL